MRVDNTQSNVEFFYIKHQLYYLLFEKLEIGIELILYNKSSNLLMLSQQMVRSSSVSQLSIAFRNSLLISDNTLESNSWVLTVALPCVFLGEEWN